MVEKNDTVAVLKPFVDGGLAGGFASYLCSEFVTHARKHPKYWRHCIKVKMIPRMIWIDAFAFSQTLGFYGIPSRKVIASTDGRRLRLDQEAACGLIAGAAGASLSFPLFLACYNKQVESMGPIAKSWRLGTSKWSHFLRNGGPWLLPRIGLGMGMVASYNPSLHYLREIWGFSEWSAEIGAAAMSTVSAAACAQLLLDASFFNSARQTLKSKGPLGFLAGFSVGEAATKVLLFWAVVHQLNNKLTILSMSVDNEK